MTADRSARLSTLTATECLIPAGFRTVTLIGLSVVTVGLMVLLAIQGAPLTTETSPWGIVSLELAWSTSNADRVVESWSTLGDTPTRQILLDFPFLVFYPVCLSLWLSLMARGAKGWVATMGVLLSWGVLFSGPLDAIENLAMLKMLADQPTEILVKLSSISALLKFGLVLSVPTFAVAAGIARIFGSIKGR
jgi:hypothetical protein